MAVSKSLRHQVMRRDSHTCRYCGAQAPDVKLTIDHVTPQTLGGQDVPENLVTACADCNAGKSATPPDAALVADIDQRAVEWGQAMQIAVERRVAELAAGRSTTEPFDAAWSRWTGSNGQTAPRDANWRNSILRFLAAGLTDQFFTDAIDTAMGQDRIPTPDKWRYFCGTCWTEVTAIQKVAQGVVSEWRAASTPAAVALPEFPYMAVFDPFLGDVIEMLGGDLRASNLANDALWSCMPHAMAAFKREIQAGAEINDAVDEAQGELSSHTAWFMHQIALTARAKPVDA